MTHAIDALLRPLVRWYFQSWLWNYLPAKEKILWFFCKHYFVVGEDALRRALAELSAKKYHILLNVCGDDATTVLEAEKTWITYNRMLNIILDLRLRKFVRLSVKVSRFGCFNKTVTYHGRKLVQNLAARAHHGDIKIVLDGERLKHCRWMLAFTHSLRKQYPDVGLRMQAYGKQFLSRFRRMIETTNVAVCKGAYDEPHWRAFTDAKKIRKNFLDAVTYALEKKRSVEVDTHDPDIISECQDMFHQDLISYGHLMNVAAWQARHLRRRENETVHIYIVFVEDAANPSWVGFSIRRLIEKPTYLFLPLKMMFDGMSGYQTY